jgi:hypothetical protein
MAKPQDNTDRIPSNALLRLLFVILFNIINLVVSKLILLVAFFQFLCHLFTGRVPGFWIRWGEAMSNWTWQMMLFMTYKTEHMPFPFHKLGSESERD